MRNRGQELIFHPARTFSFFPGHFFLPQEVFAFLLNLFSLGDIASDRQPAMLAAEIERLRREQYPASFARFVLHRELKVANGAFLPQYCQRSVAIGWVHIESQSYGALSDQLIALVAGHRDEAIVDFENLTVSDSSNDESIRAC